MVMVDTIQSYLYTVTKCFVGSAEWNNGDKKLTTGKLVPYIDILYKQQVVVQIGAKASVR